jgi:dTDP-4-dehydrorhamnose reductase
MRILLTGAGGQLGREMQEVLGQEELHALDHSLLDIADRDSVFAAIERIRPAWVINAAAFNDVDRAQSAPEIAFLINGAGPGHLADAAVRNGASIVHISSDYVFDGKKGTAYDEDDKPNPESFYARSKYEGELRVIASGASSCIIRTAWLYSRHGNNFVKAILKAAEAGKPLKVVADQVGSPTWTFDLANAIAELIKTPARGTFHVVNAGSCSRFEFAQAIVQGRVPVLPIGSAAAGRPAPRPANSSLVSTRWAAAGLKPLRSWESALSEMLETVT